MTDRRIQDIILTSVPQAVHVKKVFLDPTTGLLAQTLQPKRKILFIELSTIDAAVSEEIADRVTDGGFGTFVDAPCSVSSEALCLCSLYALAHW